MKFIIEIIRRDKRGQASVLHRSVLDVINPRFAKDAARHLLTAWRARGANRARILNGRGEELLSWQDD